MSISLYRTNCARPPPPKLLNDLKWRLFQRMPPDLSGNASDNFDFPKRRFFDLLESLFYFHICALVGFKGKSSLVENMFQFFPQVNDDSLKTAVKSKRFAGECVLEWVTLGWLSRETKRHFVLLYPSVFLVLSLYLFGGGGG